MIVAGNWHHADWEPAPPRPGSLDDCMERGFDPATPECDRVTPEPLDEKWQEWLDQSVRAAQHRREPTFEDERCGTRCDGCDERTCALYGPELRACGVTCAECPCDCTACQRQKDDLHAEVIRMIERDTRP